MRHLKSAIFLSIAMITTVAPGHLAGQTFTRITTGNPIATDGGSSGAYVGASWIDYNGDGRMDLFVNRGPLYRNDGGGAFTKLTTPFAGQGSSFGNTWADIDNDGDPDCFLSGGNPAGSILYRNDGNDAFTLVTTGDIGQSTDNKGWGTAWADYDNDGYVDVVIAAAVGFAGITNPNRLFHNNGDGTFTRIDTGVIVTGTAPYTIPTWSDFDQDGDMDLFIGAGPANGTLAPDYLYKNLLTETGTAYFEKITTGLVATDSRDGQVFNWIDYDNDGDLDVYVTNYGGGGLGGLKNDLYRNDGGSYTKIITGAIVTDVSRSLASVWQDFDNDGDLDCLVTNDGGSLNRYYQNNNDGTFTTITTGILVTLTGPHFGATAGDYDGDGDVDLFVTGQGTPANNSKGLFRNDLSNGNSWFQLRCVGTISNRAAIGTKVRVRAVINGSPVWQIREVSAQNSFNGQNYLDSHFGLGDATIIDSLVVEWPSGSVEIFTGITTDQLLTVVEGDSTPVVLVSPADGAINTLPLVPLRWERNLYGAPYRLQVSTDSLFAGGMVADTLVGDTAVPARVLSNLTRYYWRVRPDQTIHPPMWSTVRYFDNDVQVPEGAVPLSPVDSAQNVPVSPVLQWGSAARATGYHLRLGVDSLFASTVIDTTVAGTTLSTGILANLTKYYWDVRSENVGGTGPATGASSFTTIIQDPAEPVPLSPADSGTNIQPPVTLTWLEADAAATYQIQWSTENLFIPPHVKDTILTDTSVGIPVAGSFTLYYWRVRSINAAGNSTYSPYRIFRTVIASPVPLEPYDGGSQFTTPRFRWRSSPPATAYHLQLGPDSTFGSIAQEDSTITDTSFTAMELPADVTYFWRVRALHPESTSPWTATRSFVTTLDTFLVPVASGWNLVSIPGEVSDRAASVLFPGALTPFYAYDAGYTTAETLEYGRGYWVRMASASQLPVFGTKRLVDTIDVQEGWNLFAALSEPVAVSSIETIPGGLTAVGVYEYAGGFRRTDTLRPGPGYWIKMHQAGKLVLGALPSNTPTASLRIAPGSDVPPTPPGDPVAETGPVPTRYGLSQNYPNPFNPVATIHYEIPQESFVAVHVYTMLGQEVTSLVNEVREPGSYDVVFEAGNLVSGVYLYTLRAGDYTATKKMILMK